MNRKYCSVVSGSIHAEKRTGGGERRFPAEMVQISEERVFRDADFFNRTALALKSTKVLFFRSL